MVTRLFEPYEISWIWLPARSTQVGFGPTGIVFSTASVVPSSTVTVPALQLAT